MIVKEDVYLFEIPIYRCTSDKYYSEMAIERSKFINQVALKDEESNKDVSDYYDRKIRYPLNYNEVIGWISIFHNGAEVRGDLWLVKNRISHRLKKKRFFCRGKFFQYSPFLSEIQSITSEKIFQDLKASID